MIERIGTRINAIVGDNHIAGHPWARADAQEPPGDFDVQVLATWRSRIINQNISLSSQSFTYGRDDLVRNGRAWSSGQGGGSGRYRRGVVGIDVGRLDTIGHGGRDCHRL